MSTVGKVCVRCQVELRPKKNGVGGLLMSANGPHQIYDADLWVCPTCGIEVLLGFGRHPLRADHQPDFHEAIESYPQVMRFWSSTEEKDQANQRPADLNPSPASVIP